MKDKELLKNIKTLKHCCKERMYGSDFDDSKFEISNAIGHEYCVVNPNELIAYFKSIANKISTIREDNKCFFTFDDIQKYIMDYFNEQDLF